MTVALPSARETCYRFLALAAGTSEGGLSVIVSVDAVLFGGPVFAEGELAAWLRSSA